MMAAGEDEDFYVYKMASVEPRGIAVIINNEKFRLPLKSQATTDADDLCDTFRWLNFEVKRYDNKTGPEMSEILNDVAAMPDHYKYNCLMVAILTHCDSKDCDMLYGTSGKISLQSVVETFSGEKCQMLVGKPKIFIVQASRAIKREHTVNGAGCDEMDGDEIDGTPSPVVIHPNIADYLVAYSSVPGLLSTENNKSKSIFVSTLVEVFRKHANNEDLITMLERVDNEVTKYGPPKGSEFQGKREGIEIRLCLKGKIYFSRSL